MDENPVLNHMAIEWINIYAMLYINHNLNKLMLSNWNKKLFSWKKHLFCVISAVSFGHTTNANSLIFCTDSVTGHSKRVI